ASAVAIEAEYTITSPSVTRSSAAHASERSYSGAGWLPRMLPLSARLAMQGLHGGSERLAAMLVVAEHVEACARGREQHRVTGLGDRRCASHRILECFRSFDRNFPERPLDGRSVLADQDHMLRFLLHHRRERREILSLPF